MDLQLTFSEGRGIWGTWELRVYRGGFHIWPLNSGSGGRIEETNEQEQEQPIDATGRPLVEGPIPRNGLTPCALRPRVFARVCLRTPVGRIKSLAVRPRLVKILNIHY